MDVTLAAEWHIDEPRVRVAERDAQSALRTIAGKPVVPARARLRFGPGRTCEPIAWLLSCGMLPSATECGLSLS